MVADSSRPGLGGLFWVTDLHLIYAVPQSNWASVESIGRNIRDGRQLVVIAVPALIERVDDPMRRFCALLLGLAVLTVTPGVASADPFNTRPARNQQAVDYVIARALSQRGVPFTYGGGDANGPTRGVVRETPAEPAAAAIPGGVPGLNFPGLAPPAPAASPLTPSVPAVPDPAANVVGFDASGIIVYAFAGVGVKLPRSSGEMYKVGQKVLPAQALPGDLIFFGPEGTQSVALFVGSGQMLEAGDSGVTVSPVRTASMTPYLVRIIA